MTSFSANADASHVPARQVVFVIYPDIVCLDLTGPLQVFAGARHGGSGALAYETAIVSLHGGSIPTDTVVSIESEPIETWRNREIHTLVVVGGNGANTVMHDRAFLRQVSALSDRAERVCSVCSGALILAAAGLLDGRRATTHWDDCALLSRDFPRVAVDVDPIYVRDGNVWTSAGITAGLDMALAIVAEDLGHEAALKLARSLVTYMVRPGGQSQFSPVLERQALERSGRFEKLHQWIAGNLKEDLRIDRLAERENMSIRNFHRLYSQKMGLTPAKAVETIRVAAAREFLETSQERIKSVANRCGFGDEERMRRAFMRILGVSPSDYRKRFQVSGDALE